MPNAGTQIKQIKICNPIREKQRINRLQIQTEKKHQGWHTECNTIFVSSTEMNKKKWK